VGGRGQKEYFPIKGLGFFSQSGKKIGCIPLDFEAKLEFPEA